MSSLSFAYPEVDGAIRAGLARRLRVEGALQGAFVLSTCLRIELAVSADTAALEQAAAAVFGEPSAVDVGQIRVGEEAVRHLFRIAAGLESPILGEAEILTQFRQSLARAEAAGRVSGLMAKLLETAVSAGRQARELLPDSPHDSMAAVAAQVVGAADRVAVLGSGMMAQAVVAGLRGLPAPPEIVVVARTPEKVTIDGGEVWPFIRAAEALATFPAVVSATSAKRRLVPDEDLAGLLGERSAPLTLVDMAMPPDFTPPAGSQIRYVDIDMLARMADRRPRRGDADAMVAAAAADAYRRVTYHQALGPVMEGLVRSADTIVDRAVDRFGGRLADEEDRAVLRQTAHTVARTLLAGPIAYLQSTDRPAEAVDAIAEAFGLQDDG